MRSITLCLLWLALPGSNASAQDDEDAARLALEVSKSLERGRSKLLGYLLATPRAALGSARSARTVRALIASGMNPNSNQLAPILKRIAATPSSSDPEATILRIEALAAADIKLWARAIQQNTAVLMELQQSDGSFRSARSEKDRERPDAAVLTARAILAWRAAVRAGVEVPTTALERAARFLLTCAQRDGGVAERGRRSKAHGRATAAAIAAWLWMRTRPELEELHPDLERALGRSETWLLREWAVDKNPGRPATQLFGYLVELERAAGVLLLPQPEARRRNRRLDGFLLSFELPNWGWNRNARMQDFGVPPRVGNARGAHGIAPLVGIEDDPDDTALAVLALAAPTRPTDAELRYALERRMSDLKRLPSSERLDGFVELLKRRREVAIPALIGYLMAPERAARRIAVLTLRRLTGEAFGYSSRRSVEKNQEAIQRWQGWWLKRG